MTRVAAAAPWIKSRFVKRLSGRALATVGKGARGLRATGSFVRGWDLMRTVNADQIFRRKRQYSSIVIDSVFRAGQVRRSGGRRGVPRGRPVRPRDCAKKNLALIAQLVECPTQKQEVPSSRPTSAGQPGGIDWRIPGKGDKSHPIRLVRVRLPASVRGVSASYGRS